MAGNTEVKLAAGQIIEFESPTVPDTWLVLNGVTSLGSVGKTSEKKDKTTLADTQKKYGAALPDAEDKSIKFQRLSGDVDQNTFVEEAKANNIIKLRSTWPEGTVAEMELQLLGFSIDEGTAEDWIMATVPASQNSIAWTEPA